MNFGRNEPDVPSPPPPARDFGAFYRATVLPLRTYLAQTDGTGMRAVAVPMRNRGWFDLARIDPAFVSAAAGATDDVDRGFWRPLLVTRDAVNLVAPGGDVRTIVLRDPAAAETSWGGSP